MATKSSPKIKIRWIRSGIAFNRNQKEIVRSLGLRRLHQVVERQDNTVVRGLIAKVSHLVEVLEETKASAWASVPEYKVVRPEPITEVASDDKNGQVPVAEGAVEASTDATTEPAVGPKSQEPPSSEAEVRVPVKRQRKSARTKV